MLRPVADSKICVRNFYCMFLCMFRAHAITTARCDRCVCNASRPIPKSSVVATVFSFFRCSGSPNVGWCWLRDTKWRIGRTKSALVGAEGYLRRVFAYCQCLSDCVRSVSPSFFFLFNRAISFTENAIQMTRMQCNVCKCNPIETNFNFLLTVFMCQ